MNKVLLGGTAAMNIQFFMMEAAQVIFTYPPIAIKDPGWVKDSLKAHPS